MSLPEPIIRRQVAVGNLRYSLERVWGSELFDGDRPTLTWVMCNPSTADGREDDPTLRRCLGFSHQFGYRRLIVVNLFAFRATNPTELIAQRALGVDIEGPENLQHIAAAVHGVDVMFAWGSFPASIPGSQDVKGRVNSIVRAVARSAACLGVTARMEPRHPLYVPKDCPRTMVMQRLEG